MVTLPPFGGMVLFGLQMSFFLVGGADVLTVESFRMSELGESLDRLSVSLRSNGIFAVQLDEEFGHVQDAAFEGMCNCVQDSNHEHVVANVEGMDSGLLSDGVTRRTTLGTATMGTTPLSLSPSLAAQCGEDTLAAVDALRDHVAAVSSTFVAAFDRLLQGTATGDASAVGNQERFLLRNSFGGTYSTVQSIVQASKHLEHFHVYSKPEPNNLLMEAVNPSMPVHTDAGLFLAFVPGQSCHSAIRESDSFFLKDTHTGVIKRAIFPERSVAIMMGAGAENWLQTNFPLAATRHTVQMTPGEARAWYGMMHLVPDNAYVQRKPLKTLEEMRQAMVLKKETLVNRRFGDLPGSENDVSIGCGSVDSTSNAYPSEAVTSLSRRRLQHVEGPHSCNNSTNFFCWMSCLDIPDAKFAQGYINEGYSLYCLDPSVLISSGNRVSQAVLPCIENGEVGRAMNTNCMGKWAPTAPGVAAQEVVVTGAQNLDTEEQFCYGGTSMYMDGFNWVGTTCAIYLFPGWILSSVGKLVGACIGSIFFGALTEYIIRLRRDSVMSATGPRYKRLVLAGAFYGLQLTMGYSVMLVVMIYSVPLFLSVIVGLVLGHVMFNAKESIIPAKKQAASDDDRHEQSSQSERKTATVCEGPCDGDCELDRCEDECKGCCTEKSDKPPVGSRALEELIDHGLVEGSTPCCQHTL